MNLKPLFQKGLFAATITFLAIACNSGGESETTNDSTAVTTDTITTTEPVNDGTTVNDVDRNFIMMISEANMAEVDAGRTASTKGKNAVVKSFGQQMVADHSTAQKSLDSIAMATGVSVPTELNDEHKALKQKLSSLSGFAFDTAYINAQVLDHEKVIGIFEEEIANGSHQAVKDFANNNIHHIKMHHERADSIQNNIKK